MAELNRWFGLGNINWKPSWRNVLLSLLFFIQFFSSSSAFRVSYELDDRFLDYRKDAKWLVMFYAPWCHHCHKAEPIWEQVAQTFNQQEANLGLRVGKLDATKQTKSASEFHIKGFPTVKFIHGDRIVTYEGERTREDIEDFALKAIGPAVRRLPGLSELRNAEKKHSVFFIMINARKEPAGAQQEVPSGFVDMYAQVAEEFMTSTYFFEADSRLASGNIPFVETPSVAVFKDNQYFLYDGGKPLRDWVLAERIPGFLRVSGGNWYQISELNKTMLLAVVEAPAYPTAPISKQTQQLLAAVKDVALQQREKYHSQFSFGYVEGNEIVNQVSSQWIPIPAVFIYSPVEEVYYLYQRPLETVTRESLQEFADAVLAGSEKGIGGKGWFRKAYRFCYSICAYFYKMFSTQPILSSILFGLPLGILTIIIVMTYTNDCTDTAPTDEEDSDHEKEE